ncbi:hypothetical protein ACRAWF_02165 [Streptomyces sp. L7]
MLPETGALIETADPLRPSVLVDAEGAIVAPAETFFAELQANARPATTIRSYGMDLLRWWRFLSGRGALVGTRMPSSVLGVYGPAQLVLLGWVGSSSRWWARLFRPAGRPTPGTATALRTE